MSKRAIMKKMSNKSNVVNRKNSSEDSETPYLSLRKLKQNSPIKRVQLIVKVNNSLILNDFVPTYPYSQSISFRLKPIIPTLPSSSSAPNEIKTQNIKTEIYHNPKLQEKINQYKPRLHVDLSYCYLIDRDIPMIVNQVIINRKCTELWLYGNKITSQGLSILASSLTNNSTLTSLDLSFNQISDLGVRSLTQVLLPDQNSSLKILYLSKNGISDDGAKYLSEMLQTNQTLTELWLSNNEIGNRGVKQIANVLAKYNKTLKLLSLSTNIFITDLSIDYLIEMIEQNQTLKNIWINDCNLTEQGKMKLREKANQKNKFQIKL
jgi:hypothetical protein